jgi:hypothetical protein
MNARNPGLRLLEHKVDERGLRDLVHKELAHLLAKNRHRTKQQRPGHAIAKADDDRTRKGA